MMKAKIKKLIPSVNKQYTGQPIPFKNLDRLDFCVTKGLDKRKFTASSCIDLSSEKKTILRKNF